jgi:hypothetical protein
MQYVDHHLLSDNAYLNPPLLWFRIRVEMPADDRPIL